MTKRVIPHICLALSVMMLILLIVDRFNAAMSYIGGDAFDFLLLLYCLSVIPTAIWLIAANRGRC